jgi:hypothetical protein
MYNFFFSGLVVLLLHQGLPTKFFWPHAPNLRGFFFLKVYYGQNKRVFICLVIFLACIEAFYPVDFPLGPQP